MDRVTVIGAGSWGTTAAALVARNRDTVLWARRESLANAINAERHNPEYFPEFTLPDRIRATSSLRESVEGAHVVVMAVPSHGFRAVFAEIAPLIGRQTPVISLTKGIEQGTLARMTEVVAQVAVDHDQTKTGVLTGPNLASEIIKDQPTAAVVAVTDQATALRLQEIFMSPMFRVYTHDDVVGCELGGSLKNVMALAAGMSDGLGFGDNSRAALITRALAELTRLGVTLGGRPETFAGLAGMGDLIATCVSTSSRNHRVGYELAQGKFLDDIIEDMSMVAEGVKTTRAVLDLAEVNGVEMPIADHVGRVLYEGLHPKEAVLSLMTREAKPESV